MTHGPAGRRPLVEWEATPPGGPRPVRPRRRPRRYTGPPAYPAVPRWGFPMLAWRWPLALPAHRRVDPVERAEAVAATALPALWTTAVLGLLAGFAEFWRYLLLLRSRDSALGRMTLAISDALVGTTGVVLLLLGLFTGVVVVLWALRARQAAAEAVGVRNARPDWQVVAGVLVPGLNLFVPGSALAELEHTALVTEGARERGARPRPSVLVRLWWAAWIANLLLGWTAFAWRWRTGVQAMADGVVLHVWNDLLVALLAVLTALVVRYLMRLLVPLDPTELKRLRVLATRGAPPPTKAPRPAGAVR